MIPTVLAILVATGILCLAHLTFEVWKDYMPVCARRSVFCNHLRVPALTEKVRPYHYRRQGHYGNCQRVQTAKMRIMRRALYRTFSYMCLFLQHATLATPTRVNYSSAS